MFQISLLLFSTWREYFYSQPTKEGFKQSCSPFTKPWFYSLFPQPLNYSFLNQENIVQKILTTFIASKKISLWEEKKLKIINVCPESLNIVLSTKKITSWYIHSLAFRTSWLTGVYYPSVYVGRKSHFSTSRKTLVAHIHGIKGY